jgi:hypothetical protein
MRKHVAVCECGEEMYGLWEDGNLEVGYCDRLKREAKQDHSQCPVCNPDA